MGAGELIPWKWKEIDERIDKLMRELGSSR